MADRKYAYGAAEAGFTLFEVVVAIALLGLILAASLGLFGIGLRSIRYSKEYTRAALLAKQKLQSASLSALEPGTRVEGSEGALRWSTESVPEESNASELPARLVEHRVRVFWQGAKAKEKCAQMTTPPAAGDSDKLAADGASPPGLRR